MSPSAHTEKRVCDRFGAVGALRKFQNAFALSGGSPSPYVLVTTRRFRSDTSCAVGYVAKSWMAAAKPCLPASLAIRLAARSDAPVCEPNKMVSGSSGDCAGAAAAEALEGARENNPARKPFR